MLKTKTLVITTFLILITKTSMAFDLPQKSGKFEVPLSNGKTIEVNSYKPDKADKNSPIIFVLTGLKRNSAHYRDAWIADAEANNFIVIVPTFSEKNYPDVNGYNLGNLINTDSKKINPESDWSFTAIGNIFSWLQHEKITMQTNYYLFGNSAGCQFVHRFLTFENKAKVKAAICAAAGWWTLPDDETLWPYGLDQAPIKIATKSLGSYFAKPILITVGGDDNNPYHPLLRRSYQAMGQGDSRLARAKNYYLTAQQKSKRYKLDFNWSFSVVPGVGHDGSKMSAYAAKQFANFEKYNKFIGQ